MALGATRPEECYRIWPELSFMSCWTDGQAVGQVRELRRAFPQVEIQPKGLMATEACVTIPFQGQHVLAIRSHFFEFLELEGTPRLAHELREGGVYSVVITTGGGLYRYRLQDRVQVTGFVAKTPVLQFLGKEDHVSDLFGEKISEGHAQGAIQQICDRFGVQPTFAMLAPEVTGQEAHYILFLELETGIPEGFEQALNEALEANHHYAYCRTLGQLGPARVFPVTNGAQTYVAVCRQQGQRLGVMKPLLLSTRPGWSVMFSEKLGRTAETDQSGSRSLLTQSGV